MPTMPERMSRVETEVASVKEMAGEIRGDVKALLRWRDEERGARRQRTANWKAMGAVLTVLTIVINVLFKVV